MRRVIIGICISLLTFGTTYSQCDGWAQKTDFSGTARRGAVGFSIGDKGFIGTGFDGTIHYKDFWEYNPLSDTWAQKADFAGVSRRNATGFSIGNTGYIGTGWDGIGPINDFWEYDTTSNIWAQKSDFLGEARQGAVSFSIGMKGYLGTGVGANNLKDFWEYNRTTDSWTQKADVSSTLRRYAVGFSINSRGYIGTGYNTGSLKDFWEYDTTSNVWTQKADVGGTGRFLATGFSLSGSGFIGTGASSASTYVKDFWEFSVSNNTWTQRADVGTSVREIAVAFSIGGNGYLGTGYDGAHLTSFWEYTPAAPTIESESSTSNSACVGAGNGTITIVASGVDSLSYSIDGGLTFSSNSGVFTGLSSGSYSLVVKDGNGCTVTGSTISISGGTPLSGSISYNPDTNSTGVGSATITVSGGSPPYTYLWTPTGQTGPTATQLGSAQYTVVIEDTNNCTFTDSIYVGNFTGVENSDGLFDGPSIFPNPFYDEITIQHDKINGNTVLITVVDILGREVRKHTYQIDKSGHYVISGLQDLEEGAYFLTFQLESGYTVYRMIK
ncbi:MAG: T9SS type A sorting domain-containing protein [Flavobacteriales bacterium]|nr:T9SS type A sorting domain-containing protein [Flavobacteriales bacterium]